MIKINLLKNRLDAQLDQDFSSEVTTSDRRVVRLIFNLIFIFGFVVALIVYEQTQLNALSLLNNQLVADENNLASEVSLKEQEVASLGELEVQSRGMTERRNALKDLGQRRLREIKFLEFLQSVLPERVWFSSLTYDGKSLIIVGIAVQDEDLSKFLRQIENSSIFSEVILRKSAKLKEEGEDILSFEVLCSLERIS